MKPLTINRTNLFLLLTFFVNWCMAGAFILLFPNKDKVPYTIMAILYMFVPALMVVIVDKLIDKRKGWRSLGIRFNPNWWYMAAWPAVLAFAFLVLLVNILWPGISFTPDMSGFFERMSEQLGADKVEIMKAQMAALPLPMWLITILQALVAGITINAVAGFGEELGWRGFMVREYRNLKFWDASLRIGIIWGVWHAPLILMGHNYPQHPMIGVGMMVIWCVLLSPLFLYVRLKTNSVIGAAIMHGTLNASAGIPLMYIAGGNDLTAGITSIPGFIALLVAILIMVAYDMKLAHHSIVNRTLDEAKPHAHLGKVTEEMITRWQ